MNLNLPFLFQKLNLWGFSTAGVGTSLWIPELSICFDVAQGVPQHTNLATFCLAHGHLDHSAGIPYIISQKSLNKHQAPEVIVPEGLYEDLDQILKLWGKVEDFQSPYKLQPLKPGQRKLIKGQWWIEPFETVHRVACQGYSLIEVKKKLKTEFRGFTEENLKELKAKNIEINYNEETPWFAFTGDTQIEFLDRSPHIAKTRNLFMEVTYYNDKKSVADSKKWGHTHLDEVIPRLKDLSCEKIIFLHRSRRHSSKEIFEILQRRLPSYEKDRILLLTDTWQCAVL